ncbi:MAG: alpha/beta hydrolase [Epulopiscium sp.]|nr:alpha/beta hydrolase [Candidatus Epulonipiscium sp.]
MITRKEFSFPSSAEGKNIYACIWVCEGFQHYKGIVQIAHGMEEHILRYQGFAVFLANQGFIVCGNDHLGHGRSMENWEDRGHFGDGEDNWKFLIQDMHYLMHFMKNRYEPMPFFLLGHSMGSFLAREFAALYGDELSGAVFLGTSGGNAFLNVGIALCEEGIQLKGPKARGYSASRLAFGAFNIKFLPARTNYDWPSSDEKAVDGFIEDVKCGFEFTYTAYRDLFTLLKTISSLEWAQRVRKDLPMLLLSGGKDPVGDYGKGVEKVYQWLKEAGCQFVSMKLYEDGRHEVLNEQFYRKVYRYILKWLNETIENLGMNGTVDKLP